jgi:hypothetical protein
MPEGTALSEEHEPLSVLFLMRRPIDFTKDDVIGCFINYYSENKEENILSLILSRLKYGLVYILSE